MNKKAFRLYAVQFLTIATGLGTMYALIKHFYVLSAAFVITCFILNKYCYICPYCGAKLNPRVALRDTTICGNCKTYLLSGKKVDTRRLRKRDVQNIAIEDKKEKKDDKN